MEKPKYKFSLKVFALGIGLILLSLVGAFYQYESFQSSEHIWPKRILLVVVLLIAGITVVVQSFQSGVKIMQICMPASMKDKIKQAVESGDSGAYKALLKGEKVQWPCKEYAALSIEKFPDQPHLATVQYLYKVQHPTGSHYEDTDSTERVTVEEAIVKVIDQLAEHYGFFNTY